MKEQKYESRNISPVHSTKKNIIINRSSIDFNSNNNVEKPSWSSKTKKPKHNQIANIENTTKVSLKPFSYTQPI